MGERSASRALVVSRALAHRLARPFARPAAQMRRILVAHRLLLGDTLMLTPLLAKLRANHPHADIVLLAAPAFLPLYASRPYGVAALPFTPHASATVRALLDEEPFDLAVVVGDNRYGWLATAMRARHIVGHDGDVAGRNWLLDERRPYSATPRTWGEMVADLVDGAEPPPFAREQWPAPPAAPFDRPQPPYAVLHVGASSPLKRWLPERWMALAMELDRRGLAVAWSGDAKDAQLVDGIDPRGRFRSFAGKLDLAQMWHLLDGAALLVAPDTGIAHLGRVVMTPGVTLFGPGSPALLGPGAFWQRSPWRAVAVDPFPCRDQQVLFRRHVDWVRRCGRTTEQCAEPRCMHAIALADVLAAVDEMLRHKA